MNLPPPDLPESNLVPAAKPPTPLPVPFPPTVARDTGNPYAPPVAAVEIAAKERKDVYAVSESLGGLIREAFAYPLRLGGVGAMIIGAVMVLILGVAMYAPLIGIPVVLGGWAYVGAFYLEIIQGTLNGQDEAPPWPELSSLWDDVVIPGMQLLGITVISSAVQIAALITAGEDAMEEPLYWLGALVKWMYFPMATLAVVCHGSVWAALPHRVAPALVRCLPGYLVCAGAFAAAEMLQAAGSTLLGVIPVLGWFLPGVVFMYVMLVQARLTGLIYLRYQERIPW